MTRPGMPPADRAAFALGFAGLALLVVMAAMMAWNGG